MRSCAGSATHAVGKLLVGSHARFAWAGGDSCGNCAACVPPWLAWAAPGRAPPLILAPHQPPLLPPTFREFPAFVERYIATTSDMFRQFIDTGLAQLAAAEAAGGGAAPAPAARTSSSGESSGSPGGAHPGAPAAQQQQQQQAEPVARRPSPVPPLALQRPPLSPPVVSPSGAGGSLTTPGGTIYSPSNPRIAAMRERMASMRGSSEGGLGAGVGASAAGGSLPTSGRSTDEAGLAHMNNSLEVGVAGLER